jgi:hypothetical protein
MLGFCLTKADAVYTGLFNCEKICIYTAVRIPQALPMFILINKIKILLLVRIELPLP